MLAQLTILASGSSGNAAFLQTESAGLLIDCGLGPRVLAHRLAAVDLKWDQVSAVALTHTHGDHWNRLSLVHLTRLRIPLFAHRLHHAELMGFSFEPTTRANTDLLRLVEPGVPFDPIPGVQVVPLAVPHDSDPTFAFRFNGRFAESGEEWSVGFASDLGTSTRDLVRAFAGVDVLALEFNHDEAMERASGRPQLLINRVLGPHGHLSNDQAAEASRSIATQSGERFQTLIQLHLSRQCNRPELASEAGRRALAGVAPNARLFTTRQDVPCGPIAIRGRTGPPTPVPASSLPVPFTHQPRLPGLE